jgi:hypothetical protein
VLCGPQHIDRPLLQGDIFGTGTFVSCLQSAFEILGLISFLQKKGSTLLCPYADLLEDGIHELRIRLSGDQARVL